MDIVKNEKMTKITEKYKLWLDIKAKGFVIETSDYLELLSLIGEQKEAEVTKLLTDRDEHEALIEKLASILGCKDDWSNIHDHRECVVERAEHLVLLVERRNKDVDKESIEAANKAVAKVKESLIQELSAIGRDYFVSTIRN